jgi:hypothetical protein
LIASATIVIGPPASGKKTLVKLVAKSTSAVLLTKNNLIETAPIALQKEFGKDLSINVRFLRFLKLI